MHGVRNFMASRVVNFVQARDRVIDHLVDGLEPLAHQVEGPSVGPTVPTQRSRHATEALVHCVDPTLRSAELELRLPERLIVVGWRDAAAVEVARPSRPPAAAKSST
jgi:hypothetical protein